MILKTDARHAAAKKALDAMHEFHDLKPENGAVQWIEDMDGRLIVFTRAEYRETIMANVHNIGTPVEKFELEADPE